MTPPLTPSALETLRALAFDTLIDFKGRDALRALLAEREALHDQVAGMQEAATEVLECLETCCEFRVEATPMTLAPLRAALTDELLAEVSHASRALGLWSVGAAAMRDTLLAALGPVLEQAHEEGRQSLDVEGIRADCHATFNGGHEGRECEVFHHGMDTVCNVLEAHQKGERTNGILPAPPERP